MAEPEASSPVLTTGFDVPGRPVAEIIGPVFGITVRTADWGSKVAANLRGLGGGELPELTRVAHDVRAQAIARLLDEARRVGADAVIGMRFDSSDILAGNTEVFAYGTAVRLVAARRR